MSVPAKPLSRRIFELDKLRYDRRNHVVLAARTAAKIAPDAIPSLFNSARWRWDILMVLKNPPKDILAERWEEGSK